MTIQEAIEARHSVRAYTGQPLAADVVEVLGEKIRELNEKGHLHMQLIRDETKAFQGKLAKYGKFRGVNDYIVMAGHKADDLDERIGYYGEQLVLLAQTLGLNTCWVGLSYSKEPMSLKPERSSRRIYPSATVRLRVFRTRSRAWSRSAMPTTLRQAGSGRVWKLLFLPRQL